MTFEKRAFGEFASFRYGKMPNKNRISDNGKYPIFSGYRITGYYDEYNLEENELVIVARGVGGTGDVKLSPAICYLTNLSIAVEMNEEIALKKYLYYYFAIRNLRYLDSGSAQSQITISDLEKVVIPIPDMEEQKKIVAVLSSIDEKIKQNTAINENLEQQAQALFKAWFVDFEPFGGVMPDDWRMGTLSEICGYSKDKVDIDDLTLDTYYSTENMQPNRQGAVQATTLPTIKQTTACKKGDVLISNIRPYFKKILYCFSDCGCSTDVLCFVPNKTDYSAFLYCALYADKFFDYMVAGSKGTKMPRGDKQQIIVYPICIPSAEYIERFNQAVAPMLETVYTNRVEASNLANLRDTLLPKLMNGEIDVSAVKI